MYTTRTLPTTLEEGSIGRGLIPFMWLPYKNKFTALNFGLCKWSHGFNFEDEDEVYARLLDCLWMRIEIQCLYSYFFPPAVLTCEFLGVARDVLCLVLDMVTIHFQLRLQLFDQFLWDKKRFSVCTCYNNTGLFYKGALNVE